jgi:hypothetical protein
MAIGITRLLAKHCLTTIPSVDRIAHFPKPPKLWTQTTSISIRNATSKDTTRNQPYTYQGRQVPGKSTLGSFAQPHIQQIMTPLMAAPNPNGYPGV